MPVFLCLAATKAYIATHATMLESFTADYGAVDFDVTTDTFCAIFHREEALQCALALHAYLMLQPISVGMALHVSTYERLGSLLMGAGLVRSRHVAQVAWGGQILLTQEYVSMLRLPPEAALKSLGSHMLADLGSPTLLYQLLHPDLPTENFPPLRSLSYYPHNLRVQTTTFVGRSCELQELITQIRAPETRLITLTGAGGIGKTRLALQAAATVIRDFPHGVFFIPCEALTAPSLLPSMLMQLLRLKWSERLDARQQLLNQLRRRSLLLVFDNYESLLPDTELLTAILQEAPRVKILLTSREALGLPEEHLMTLEGLTFPRRQHAEDLARFETFDAVQLFFLAAIRANPFFTVTEATRPAIIAICEMTEGLPLALELAATLVCSFTCEEIARTIEQGLDYLLTTRRDLSPRHRSLRVVFEYTWEKLPAVEQETFVACAVFRGTFSAMAVEEILGVTSAVLQSLVQKSMLIQPASQRYKLHPLLLHYAREKLAANPQLQAMLAARHGATYLALLKQQESLLWSPKQWSVLELLAEDMENIRAAWLWACRAGQFGLVHENLMLLFSYHLLRGQYEDGIALFRDSAELLQAALIAAPTSPTSGELARVGCRMAQGLLLAYRAQNEPAQVLLAPALEFYEQQHLSHEAGTAHCGLGMVAFNRGQYARALSHYQRFYDLSVEVDCRLCQRDALHYLGWVSYLLGDYSRAKECLDRSLAFSEAIGDWWLRAHTIRIRGNVEQNFGNMEGAREYYLRSLQLARDFGSLEGISTALNNLAVLAVIASDYTLARRYWEQAVTLQRDAGNPRALANTLHNLSVVMADLGELDEALQLLQEALDLHRALDNKDGEAYALLYQGYALEVLGKNIAAESAYREALRLFQDTGNQRGVADAWECLGAFLVLQGRYLEAEGFFQQALTLRMSLGNPGGLITPLRGLGSVALADGRYAEAQQYFRRALGLAVSTRWIGALLYTLVEAAEFRAQTGDVVGALMILLPVLQDHRTVYPVQRRVRRRVAELLGQLPVEFVVAMQRYQRSVDVLTLGEKLASAL